MMMMVVEMGDTFTHTILFLKFAIFFVGAWVSGWHHSLLSTNFQHSAWPLQR